MARIRRTDELLHKASEAVDYDVKMMQAMLQRQVGTDTPQDQPVANAMLHSCLLAARNLCEFLYSPKQPRPDDIVAEDFFDNPDDWKKLRPPSQAEFEEGSLAGIISRRLLHLTYERAKQAKGTKLGWGGVVIAWKLGKPLEVFVAEVQPERLSEELVEDVATMRHFLRRYLVDCGLLDAVESAPLWAEKDSETDDEP